MKNRSDFGHCTLHLIKTLKMAISVFLRDNLNAFSFNMLVISAMDIVSFFALFILCLPLPDIMRKTYCSVGCYGLFVMCSTSSRGWVCLRSLWCFAPIMHLQRSSN